MGADVGSQKADREGLCEMDAASEARAFAEVFVQALLAGRYGEVYDKMDSAFRAVVPRDQMAPMVDQMYDAYGGKPIEAELKTEEQGCRTDDGVQRPVYKFWYALRSMGFTKGVFPLFVELLPHEQDLVCSSFFVTPMKKRPEK
jgi:hypothetical protein